MRKHVILLVFLFSFISGNAQEINVQSISQDLRDLEASTKPKFDLNDDPCALIKVAIPKLRNIQFLGNIVDVIYTPGEYWVYVPHGTKRIKLQHENYLPCEIDFSSKGISIESKTVYKVVLCLPKEEKPITSQEITFLVSPASAKVYVDNREWGSSYRITRDVPLGNHKYDIIANGYKSASGEFYASSASPNQELRVSLDVDDGWIELKDFPRKSKQYIGKVRVDMSNSLYDKHHIRIKVEDDIFPATYDFVISRSEVVCNKYSYKVGVIASSIPSKIQGVMENGFLVFDIQGVSEIDKYDSPLGNIIHLNLTKESTTTRNNNNSSRTTQTAPPINYTPSHSANPYTTGRQEVRPVSRPVTTTTIRRR